VQSQAESTSPSQTYAVRVADGNGLLVAVVAMALLSTAALVAVIESKLIALQGDGQLQGYAVTSVFVGVLIGGGVALFRHFAPPAVIVLDVEGLVRTTAGRAVWSAPWERIASAQWLQDGPGDVLTLTLTDGTTVQWTHSAWMPGYGAFGHCAKAICDKVGARTSQGF
jgi:hypothetical protein